MKIRVHSKRDSFRRAGFAFGRNPVELTAEDLGKNQKEREERLEMLRNEPMLVVEEVAEDKGQGKKQGGN
jgi:hypothetical protein